MVGKKNGIRFAVIDNDLRYCIPTEMLGLSAGKDAWMRDILVKCSCCRTPAKAGEMECEMCRECYDKAGEENARQDGN